MGVKAAKEDSKPEPKEFEHGARVIADRISHSHSDVVHFRAGQNCGEAQACLLKSVELC